MGDICLFLSLTHHLSGDEIDMVRDVDFVQNQVAFLTFDLGRERRVGYLRIKHRGIHSFVLEVHGSLSVHSRMETDALRFHLLRTTEQGDHRIDGIDADVHHRAVGQFRLECIQYDALLEFVVARGVLAIAGEVTSDGSQILQMFLGDGEVRIEGGNHGFH